MAASLHAFLAGVGAAAAEGGDRARAGAGEHLEEGQPVAAFHVQDAAAFAFEAVHPVVWLAQAGRDLDSDQPGFHGEQLAEHALVEAAPDLMRHGVGGPGVADSCNQLTLGGQFAQGQELGRGARGLLFDEEMLSGFGEPGGSGRCLARRQHDDSHLKGFSLNQFFEGGVYLGGRVVS